MRLEPLHRIRFTAHQARRLTSAADDPADLAVVDVARWRQPRRPGDALRGQMARVDMRDDRPAGLVQRGDEAAGGFLRIAVALKPAAHDPGHLGRAGTWASGRDGRLDRPGRGTGGAHPDHPVAPELA